MQPLLIVADRRWCCGLISRHGASRRPVQEAPCPPPRRIDASWIGSCQDHPNVYAQDGAIRTGPGAALECGTGRFDPVGRSDRVTIAALLVWMCTAAAGGYLLATRARPADAGPAAELEPQPAPVPAAAEPDAPGA